MFKELLKRMQSTTPLAKSPQKILDGGPLTSDWKWIQCSDPSLTPDGRKMYFTSINQDKLHILEASRSDLTRQDWQVNPTPVLSPDQDAVETPSYILFNQNGVLKERIYYTQWTHAKNNGGKHNYSIGMAEKVGTEWKKQTVLEAKHSWEKDSSGTILGDQSVLHVNGKFYMFYQVGSDGVTSLVVAESDDGIYWPSERRTRIDDVAGFPDNLPNGPYHVSVKYINNHFYFFGWLPKSDLNKQGIWRATSRIDDIKLSNFQLILPETGWLKPSDGTKQKSHELGLFGCDVVYTNKWYIYFHTVNTNTDGANVSSIGYAELKNV